MNVRKTIQTNAIVAFKNNEKNAKIVLAKEPWNARLVKVVVVCFKVKSFIFNLKVAFFWLSGRRWSLCTATVKILSLVETERQVSNETELLDSKIISAEASSIRVPNDLMPPIHFENDENAKNDFQNDRIVHKIRQSLFQIPINEIQFEIDQTVNIFAKIEFQFGAESLLSHWLMAPGAP